jgi:hypothetical protein
VEGEDIEKKDFFLGRVVLEVEAVDETTNDAFFVGETLAVVSSSLLLILIASERRPPSPLQKKRLVLMLRMLLWEENYRNRKSHTETTIQIILGKLKNRISLTAEPELEPWRVVIHE